jgi:RNA polymerase sigma factor (sigma-70 family)
MSSPTLAGFLTRGGTPDARPDADVVREYTATASDAAFAELVRRFAPLVWGVCRRTVGHRQHAEDAFQAAFVVLARKAGSVRPPGAVGGWLHAVAVHTSLRVRTMTDRRRRRHRPLTADPASPLSAEPTDPAALRALDEEIAKLPDAQRAAVALCELGGVSRSAAAARLGVAEGTLSSRLAAARKTLAARLRGRGVTLAAALALVSTADATPAVSPIPSDAASTLADGVIRAMFIHKLKLTAVIAALAVTALLAAGGWLLPAAAKDPPQLDLKLARPLPKPKEGMIAYVEYTADGYGVVMVVKPDGEEVARITGFDKDGPPSGPKLSRDGKRVAVFVDSPDKGKPADDAPPGVLGQVQVYDLESPGKPVAALGDGLGFAFAVWGADNTTLYVNHSVWKKGAKGRTHKDILTPVLKFDVATGKSVSVELPEQHRLNDVSADGKTFLLSHQVNNDKDEWHMESYTADAATLKLKRVTQASVDLYRLSPDGTKAVGAKFLSPKFGAEHEFVVIDLKDGTETAVKMGDEDTVNLGMVVWNADGTKLLVERRVVDGVKNEKPYKKSGNITYLPKNKTEVTIREPDGSKPKAFPVGKWAGQFDWR